MRAPVRPSSAAPFAPPPAAASAPRSGARCAASLAVLLLAGCAAGGPEFEPSSGTARFAPTASQAWHVGPDVEIGGEGPARYVDALLAGFRTGRAMDTLRFVDRFYRAPANDGYEAVVDHLVTALEEAGFRRGDPAARLQLDVLSQPMELPAWTPLSARLTLLTSSGSERVLQAFDSKDDGARTMLPMNAPSAEVVGGVALSLDDLDPGEVLVTKANLSQVLKRAHARGAAAVLSASLYSFNIDPSGADRHLDAIQYRRLDAEPAVPVLQISPRVHRELELAVLRDQQAAVRVEATVRLDERPLRTVVATVIGEERPDEAVAVVSHIQEPGACDNASGVAGLLESVVGLAEALDARSVPWPRRTVSFVWGDEFEQSRAWLAATSARPIAAISSDMTGQARETGAIALLERMPDPGAVRVLPPDAHTPWGAREVDPESLAPNGFAIVARCAMVDVGLREEGGWQTADHPYEGGSDHDVFIPSGIPAVLFWHFTDFTYHTSLDRLAFVDPAELRRTQCAILATALAVADAMPDDLGRYLKSLDKEIELRVSAAEAEDDAELVALWQDWGRGARRWLRNLCLGIDEPLPVPSDELPAEAGAGDR